MSFPGHALQRAWHLVDASNQTVGRLAGQIAQILKGKHKPTFQPNKDMGDHVVVINAEKVRTSIMSHCFLLVEVISIMFGVCSSTMLFLP
jgi:ribosomal protein L13